MAKTQKEIDDLKKEYASLKTKLNDLNEDELKEVIGGSFDYLPEGYIKVGSSYICDNYEDSPYVPPFAHGNCEGCIHCEHMQSGWYYFDCCKNSKNFRYL